MVEIINKNKYWLIANIIGLSLYFYFVKPSWLTIAQQDIPWESRVTDPVIEALNNLWLVTCFPILLTFFIFNLIWLVCILINVGQRRLWNVLIWFFVAVVWIIFLQYSWYRSTHESERIEYLRNHERIYP